MPLKSICNLPEELLIKQTVIDSIPSIIEVSILIIGTLVAYSWWLSARKELSHNASTGVFILISLVALPLWFYMSGIIVNTATNVFNPEYAILVKFATNCPK
jgi:hypothetical protein